MRGLIRELYRGDFDLYTPNPGKPGIEFGPGEESCSVPKRGRRRRCAMGPAWQREKGWDPAVSSRKEGGEGAWAAYPKRELGRGALGRDLAVA